MGTRGKEDDGDGKQSRRDGDGQWPKGRPIPTHDPTKPSDRQTRKKDGDATEDEGGK